MIFATVGTNHARFDRLLKALDAWDGDEDLVVQHGPSPVRPHRASALHEFLSFEESVAYVRAARVVVTHAGVGSVLVALANGRRPIVAPRLRRFGEAVDDHQLALARRLAADGHACLIDLDDNSTLDAALTAADMAHLEVGDQLDLVGDLRDYLERTLRR